MIAILFAFLCLGVGAFAEDECRISISDDQEKAMADAQNVPGEELLKEICPGLISHLDCVERREVMNAPEERQQQFLDLKHIVLDICEEDSRLQKAYLASVECFRDSMEWMMSCKQEGFNVYTEYRESIPNDVIEVDNTVESSEDDYDYDPMLNEPMCLTTAYAVACLTVQIQKECSELAYETVMELFRRSNVIQDFCRVKESPKMRSDLLAFLSQKGHSNLDAFEYFLGEEEKSDSDNKPYQIRFG